MRTQDIQLFPHLNSGKGARSNKASVDLHSKRWMVAESSEEVKSKVPVDTEFEENMEVFQEHHNANRKFSNNSKECRSDNALNCIFDIEEILASSKQRSEKEDRKIENNENDNDNAIKMQRVVERNLLELNEYQGSNSIQNQSSENKSSVRNSYPSFVNVNLETKEGWLLKRSFNNPSIWGWQKRYWVVKAQKFMYYKTEEQDILDGVIDFNLLTWFITIPNRESEDDSSSKLLL